MNRSLITTTPEEIAAAAADAIAHRAAALEAVYAVPDARRTFANTIEAIEHAGERTGEVGQTVHVLFCVHPDAAVRAAAQEASDRIEEAVVRQDADRRQWTSVIAWRETGELERLTGPQRKLADDRIRDLTRRGFALDDATFATLTELRVRLKQLETSFEEGINNFRDGIWVERASLAGLPARYIDQLERDDHGRYHVGLEYPELFPFMQFSEDDDARKTLGHLQLRKGGPDSMERLVQMIRLRQRIAGLLGYPNHAAYQLEPRMAGAPATALGFIEEVLQRLSPLVERDIAELIAYKRRFHPEPSSTLGFHEVSYWSHRMKKERFELDPETLRQYFPLSTVIEGMFSLFGSVYGLTFTAVPDAPSWHESCTTYRVSDARDGQELGSVIFDLHPRDGKYGHAMTSELRLARGTGTERIPGLVALVCNFTPPSGDIPALLDHDELETLLHEFGHVLHTLLSQAPYASQNGFGCPLDFVEAPSQMAEYWAWHPESLRLLSRHWQTGEPLPQPLLERLLASRTFLQGIYYTNVALKSRYDLEMHSGDADAPVDAESLAKRYIELARQYQRITLPDDAIMAAGWDHMADYDAGYYSYLWSRIRYALSLFALFTDDSVLSSRVGARIRSSVFAVGTSRREDDSVAECLGRPPTSDAFFRDLGLS